MSENPRPRFNVQPPGAPSPSGVPLRPPSRRYDAPEVCACGEPVIRSWPVRSGGREVGRIWTCKACRPEGVITIEREEQQKGRYEDEYRWAEQHPALPACKTLLDLAVLYYRKADAPTLGLIQGAAADVRRLMDAEPQA